MSDQQDRWADVGKAITDRIDELELTWAEITAQSGISFKTMKRYAAGEPIVRADKRRELCRVLKWSPDAIDFILDGMPPPVKHERRVTDPISFTDHLDDRVNSLRADLADERAARRSEVQVLRDQVEELIDQVTELRIHVDVLRGVATSTGRATSE